MKVLFKSKFIQGAKPELSPSTVVKGDSSGSTPCMYLCINKKYPMMDMLV